MRKLLLLAIIFFTVVGFKKTEKIRIVREPPAGTVEITKANFPDPIFREYIYASFDTNSDGELSKEEILAVTKINVKKSRTAPNRVKISSLEGLSYFVNLSELKCDGNKIKSLDISKNSALTVLGCSSNLLTSLDVSQNPNLIGVECYYNNITALDVSNNLALKALGCGGNKIETLDLSKNIALKALWCYDNRLTTLDLSQNVELLRLSCDANRLTSIDVSKCTKLIDLRCEENRLTTLDVSNNNELEMLDCDLNPNLSVLKIKRGKEFPSGLFCTYKTKIKDHDDITWID